MHSSSSGSRKQEAMISLLRTRRCYCCIIIIETYYQQYRNNEMTSSPAGVKSTVCVLYGGAEGWLTTSPRLFYWSARCHSSQVRADLFRNCTSLYQQLSVAFCGSTCFSWIKHYMCIGQTTCWLASPPNDSTTFILNIMIVCSLILNTNSHYILGHELQAAHSRS